MADDFAPLDDALDGLLASIEPGARGRLAGKIATDLRNANAKRIRANVTPEGAPMAPRKAKASGGARTRRLRDRVTRVKRSQKMGKMFQRAAGPSVLRKQSSPDDVYVGYPGALARVMAVHHYGLRDTVTRDPSSPAVTYPARPVIGITAEDRARVLDMVIAQIDG